MEGSGFAWEEDPGPGELAYRLFPGGTVTGPAFIGHRRTRRRLAANVREGRHTLIVAPPRYGKTSLVGQLWQELRYGRPRVTCVRADLLPVHDLVGACHCLLEAAGLVAPDVVRRQYAHLDTFPQRFDPVTCDLYITRRGMEAMRFAAGTESLETLDSVLSELDAIAVEHDCRVMFVIEEAQQLATLRGGEHVEALLQRVMRRSRTTVFVLTAARLHRTGVLFAPGRPLAESCERLDLGTVDTAIWADYVTAACQAQWGCNVGARAMKLLFSTTMGHPYYLGALLRRLWCRDVPPVMQSVTDAWDDVVRDHHHAIASILGDISANQRAVLVALGAGPTARPRAKRFVQGTRLASASVGQAIKVLLEQDLIHSGDDGVLRVSDPALAWYLRPPEALP